jgi:hypothetical protein
MESIQGNHGFKMTPRSFHCDYRNKDYIEDKKLIEGLETCKCLLGDDSMFGVGCSIELGTQLDYHILIWYQATLS